MGDAILYWNDIALEANRVSHSNGKDEQTGPTLSARALAIVHLAMYDAFVGADKVGQNPANLSHYMSAPAIPAPPAGTSPDTAVAAAAYHTLHHLFPSQRPFFDLIYDPDYTPAGQPPTGAAAGHAYGKKVAERLIAARKNDPGKSDVGYAPQPLPGRHRPDPDNPGQGFHAPAYGAGSTLFATKKRYTLQAPPDLASNDYRKALRQVREKGIAPELLGTLAPNDKPRTEDETVVGIYWGYDGALGLGTPPRLYNQIIRDVATKIPNPKFSNQINKVAQNARLFALVNAAMADAAILAWEQKYVHDLWRPVLGIREHGPSLGPEDAPDSAIGKDADTGWLPLGAPNTNRLTKNFTPPFPAYPSGHATFGAAAFHIARLFYGRPAGDRKRDDLFKNLSFVSEELNGVNTDNKGAVRPRHVRDFDDGLWTMIVENGLSRVYLGVHWIFDAFAAGNNEKPDLGQGLDLANGIAGIGGVPLGLAIAEDIFANGMEAADGAAPGAAMQALNVAEALSPEVVVNLSAVAPALPWPLG